MVAYIMLLTKELMRRAQFWIYFEDKANKVFWRIECRVCEKKNEGMTP